MSRKSDHDESISPDVPDFEPAGRPFSLQEKRHRFMEVVVELQPMVLEKLRAMYEQFAVAGTEWHYPNLPPALKAWGDNWWLKDFWCFFQPDGTPSRLNPCGSGSITREVL